jgi:HK97 family phage major capsid protein
MATVAATVKSILFGRLRQYKLRMVRSVRMYRLTERHRENDQDAFLAFIEADGNLLNAGDNPVKHLVHP